MKIIAQHIVEDVAIPQRLSDYCVGVFDSLPSRKGVKKAIQARQVLLNGKLGYTGDWVKNGALIQLLAPTESNKRIYEMSIPIIYEDEYLAVVNKPAGIIVSGNQFRTLSNVLLYNLTASQEIDALAQPTPVHRLDALTAGLLIIAKTAKVQLELGNLFATRAIQKTYHAIVIGRTAPKGIIESAIDGKQALTHFEKIKEQVSLKNEYLSWVSLTPHTGRTHQLRIHLARINHPIMGDKIYGQAGKVYLGKGLFLAAVGLQFQHPLQNRQLNLQIEAPNKFSLLFKREARMWERHQK